MADIRVKVPKRKLGEIGKQIGTKCRRLQRTNGVVDSDTRSDLALKCTRRTRGTYDATQPNSDINTREGNANYGKTGTVVTVRETVDKVRHVVSDEGQTKPDVEKSGSGTSNATKGNNVFERKDSGYDSGEGFDEQDESDVIVANDITLSLDKVQPKSIDRRTPWSRLSGESPVENHLIRYGDLNDHSKVLGLIKNSPGPSQGTPIRIIHEYEDSDQGDEFGATLRTWETTINGEKIRQHFLDDVEKRGPADKMRIKNRDEIVLLNDIFVPDKTHEEVIKLFHDVKVDGKTRFRLVIRRVHTRQESRSKSSQKTWQWMETSAILAPDYKQILNDQPVVEAVKSDFLPSNSIETREYKRYQTHSRHLYLDINEHGLIANKNNSRLGDRTKIIVKYGRYTQDANAHLTFYAALRGIDQERYIHMDNDGVTLKDEKEWFKINGAIGNNVLFMSNEMYLGCNEDTGKIEVKDQPYRFHEINVKDVGGFDHPDIGMSATMDCTTNCDTTISAYKHSMHLSLNAGNYRSNEEIPSTLTYENSLRSPESFSENHSPEEMDTGECTTNYFNTEPTISSLPTPTTPIAALYINK